MTIAVLWPARGSTVVPEDRRTPVDSMYQVLRQELAGIRKSFLLALDSANRHNITTYLNTKQAQESAHVLVAGLQNIWV